MFLKKLLAILFLGHLASCNESIKFEIAPSASVTDSSACVGPHSGPVLSQSDFENRINLMYTNSPNRGCISFANFDFAPFISGPSSLPESERIDLFVKLHGWTLLSELIADQGGGTIQDVYMNLGYGLEILDLADINYISYFTPTVLAGKQSHLLNWSNVDVSDANLSHLKLINVNLSTVKGLSGSQLNNGLKIWGAVLPKMDVTGFNTTGKDLSFIDFRNVTGLTAEMLNLANGVEKNDYRNDLTCNYNQALMGIKYPTMNVESLSFAGRDFSHSDFSFVSGLTTEKLSSSGPSEWDGSSCYGGSSSSSNVVLPPYL